MNGREYRLPECSNPLSTGCLRGQPVTSLLIADADGQVYFDFWAGVMMNSPTYPCERPEQMFRGGSVHFRMPRKLRGQAWILGFPMGQSA